jgi:hypothetical protein
MSQTWPFSYSAFTLERLIHLCKTPVGGDQRSVFLWMATGGFFSGWPQRYFTKVCVAKQGERPGSARQKRAVKVGSSPGLEACTQSTMWESFGNDYVGVREMASRGRYSTFLIR